VSIETPAQGMSAGTDETLEAAQGETRQPGPKDAPGTQGNPTPTDVNTLIERLEYTAKHGVLRAIQNEKYAPPDEAAQALRAMQARVGEWQPIESAPYEQDVEIRVGGMTFLAHLIPDGSLSGIDQTCDQWRATNEGEHPPCWSGGACWESNEDEVSSLQPEAWRSFQKEAANGI